MERGERDDEFVAYYEQKAKEQPIIIESKPSTISPLPAGSQTKSKVTDSQNEGKASDTRKGEARDASPLPDYLNRPLHMLRLIVQSSFIKPLSCMLIARPSAGKNHLMDTLKNIPYVYTVTDMTPKYQVKLLQRIEMGQVKVLVIGDYSQKGHSSRTKATFEAILRALQEEGITNLDDFGLEFHAHDKPVKATVITSITPGDFANSKPAWMRSGFLRRWIPYSFDHSEDTQKDILDNITAKEIADIYSFKYDIDIKPELPYPALADNKDRMLVELLAQQIAKQTASLPYAHCIQIITMLESLAILRRSHNGIQDEDIDLFQKLYQNMNYDGKAL